MGLEPVKTESHGKEAYKCPKCGFTEFWEEDINIHLTDCQGTNNRKKRFRKGDVTRLSSLGRKRLGINREPGKIVGFPDNADHMDHIVETENGRYAHYFLVNISHPQPYKKSFIQKLKDVIPV